MNQKSILPYALTANEENQVMDMWRRRKTLKDLVTPKIERNILSLGDIKDTPDQFMDTADYSNGINAYELLEILNRKLHK